MKKTILLFVLATAILLSLASCGKKGPDADNTKPPYTLAALPDWQSYRITYSSDASEQISSAFTSLVATVREKLDVSMALGNDFALPDDPIPADTLEILIGTTNRSESISLLPTLKSRDFIIKLENNRLVILGGSDEATSRALEYYIQNFITDEGLCYPQEGYEKKADYRVERLTIGGVDVSEYVIVRGSGLSSEERLMAGLVQDAISAICGVEIPYVLSSAPEQKYEILLGNTGRAESSKPVDAERVCIEQTENKIALYGNGDRAVGYLIKYFINDVIGAIPKAEAYDISLTDITNAEYTLPSLSSTNLPISLDDYTGKYGTDFMNNENVLARFFASVDEFPEEISVLEPINANDYLLSMRTQLYVAPDGDDEASGDINSPLASLEEALKRLEGKNGGVIWVRGGVYELSHSIDITATGTLVSPVYISAYENETPLFTISKKIPVEELKEVDYSLDAVAARIPAEVQPNIVYANLLELGWTAEELGTIGGEQTPKLYINGTQGNLARYPNAGESDLYFDTVIDTGSVSATTDSDLYDDWIKRVKRGDFDNKEGVTFYTDAAGNRNLDWGWTIRLVDLTPCFWVNTGNIWYYGNVFEGWETAHYNIASFDVAKKRMTSKTGSTFGAKHSSNSPTGYNNYYLYNIIEALDTAGEWFYDVDTGNFYMHKTENFEASDIRYAASSTPIFNLSKSSCVVINGFSLDTAGVGVYVSESDNIVIQNCTVKNTSGSAIQIMKKSRECAVIYNDVSLAGDIMILVDSENNNYSRISCDRNIIQNNYLHDPTEKIQGGIRVGGHLSVVSHNYLDDCQISFSSSAECIVEYNDLSGGANDVSDSGLIYLTQYNHHGNHIRYNYLHDWNATGTGVYFDDLSSGNYIYYNIIDTTASERDSTVKHCYISSGHYNVVYGNICVGRNADGIVEQASYFTEASHLGYRFKPFSSTLITRYDTRYDKTAFGKRFPEYDLFMQRMKQHQSEREASGYVRNELEIYLRAPGNNVIMNNLILGVSRPIYLVIEGEKNSVTGQTMKTNDLITKNYSNKDTNAIVPNFQDGDYSISDTALAEIRKEIPDFLPITTENIGTTYEINK